MRANRCASHHSVDSRDARRWPRPLIACPGPQARADRRPQTRQRDADVASAGVRAHDGTDQASTGARTGAPTASPAARPAARAVLLRHFDVRLVAADACRAEATGTALSRDQPAQATGDTASHVARPVLLEPVQNGAIRRRATRLRRAGSPVPSERVVQLVRRCRRRPGLLAPRSIASASGLPGRPRSRDRQPPPRDDGLRAAFLERRVVEGNVGPRSGQHLGEGRGRRGHVARDHPDRAPTRCRATGINPSRSIASWKQSSMVCPHERVIGISRSPTMLSKAGHLLGKHAREQVVGACAGWAGTLLPPRSATGRTDIAFQRQRAVNIGASSIACASTSRTLFSGTSATPR